MRWSNAEPEATNEMIRETERRLAAELPKEVVEFLRTHGGARPEKPCFAFEDPTRGRSEGFLAALLSMNPDSRDAITRVVENLAVDDQLPKGFVPIGKTGGGDYVCLDSTASSPRVVYWSHDRFEEEAVSAIAPSFSAFLTLLAPRSY